MFNPQSSSDFAPITYQRLLEWQRARDLPIQAVPVLYSDTQTIHGYHLIVEIDGLKRFYSMWDDDSEWSVFQADVLPYCDKEIDIQEIRFKTHDFADKSDWDGRTHGDQVAYLAGAVMKHPIDGSWLNSTGAAMIEAYGTPEDPNYGNPAYLFGALAQRITNVYDDVNYKWTSADGATRYAWLDLSVTPPVWKNDAGTVVVHYGVSDPRISLPTATKAENDVLAIIASCVHNGADEPVAGSYVFTVAAGTSSGYKFTYNSVDVDNVAWVQDGEVVIDGGVAGELTLTMGAAAPGTLPQSDTVEVEISANPDHMHWVRDDNDAVVTTNLWRILPYSGYKIQINKTMLQVDTLATFTGEIHYAVYMDLDAGVAGPGYPAGNYPVKNWSYATLADFQEGCDSAPYVEPMTRAGHTGPIMTMVFDYKASTRPQVIDSRLNMHLDIFTSNNLPAQNTKGANATFVCLKVRSF